MPFMLQFLFLLLVAASTRGFVLPNHLHPPCSLSGRCRFAFVSSLYSSVDDNNEDKGTDAEGAFLAEEFSKFAKMEGIELNDDDLLDDDEVEEDEEEEESGEESSVTSSSDDTGDEEESNILPGITDDQLYSEVKERVLDTAGGFAKLVGGVDSDEEEGEDGEPKKKEYKPPTTVPDSGLTAGEVVELVLDALLHNDVPTNNRGLEILFEYSSPTSQIKEEVGLTPQEYGEYLKETEYKVLFDHGEVFVDKGDYAFDGKKAFFTARLRVGPGPKDFCPVNFILSTKGHEEDDCWLVDSMLIRPQSMRRRRRR